MTVLYLEMRNKNQKGDLNDCNTEEIVTFFGLALYLYQKILKVKCIQNTFGYLTIKKTGSLLDSIKESVPVKAVISKGNPT